MSHEMSQAWQQGDPPAECRSYAARCAVQTRRTDIKLSFYVELPAASREVMHAEFTYAFREVVKSFYICSTGLVRLSNRKQTL